VGLVPHPIYLFINPYDSKIQYTAVKYKHGLKHQGAVHALIGAAIHNQC